MTKKFGQVLKVWSQYGSFLVKRRRLDAARNLLQRSLKVLTSKQDRKETNDLKIHKFNADKYSVHRSSGSIASPKISPTHHLGCLSFEKWGWQCTGILMYIAWAGYY